MGGAYTRKELECHVRQQNALNRLCTGMNKTSYKNNKSPRLYDFTGYEVYCPSHPWL